MSLWQGFFLGLVQGVTEFLPISSSGHLVIFQNLFGLEGSHLAFDVLVHGATLGAIVFYFRQRLARLATGRRVDYLGKLVLGTVPIGIVGLVWGRPVEAAFGSPWLVAALLAVTGTVLLTLYLRPESDRGLAGLGTREPGWGVALAIGLAQAAAILPGISRSGSTIVAAIWLGLAPAAAAEFSFLLGIPAIAGAVAVKLPEMRALAATGMGAELLVGALAAFVSGLAAIAVVFHVLERGVFRRFGFYCWGVVVVFGAWLLWAGGTG